MSKPEPPDRNVSASNRDAAEPADALGAGQGRTGQYGRPTGGIPAPQADLPFLSLRRIPAGLLCWLVLAAAWLAFAPFRLRTGPPAFQLDLELDAETLTHLALLVPAGLLMAASGESRNRRVPWVAIGIVTLLAVTLEAGQWWLDARSLSKYDLGAGWIGGIAAIAVTRSLARLGVRVPPIAWGVSVGIFLALAVAINVSTFRQNQGLRLQDWNPLFALAQGDETDGTRPYAGDVTDARLCAGDGDARFCITPGASIEQRSRLSRIAEETQSVSLSAWVRSSDNRQTGPARIVTFSDGPYARNVTLAQHADGLILRIRTPRSGPNGHWYQFGLRHSIVEGTRMQVEGSYRGGRVQLSSSGPASRVEGSWAAPFRGTLFVNGASRFRAPLVFHGRSLLVGMLVFFAGVGLWIGIAFGAGDPRIWPLTLLFGLALLWILTLGVWHSALPRFSEQVWVLAALLAGVAGGCWDRWRLTGGAPRPDARARQA